MADDLRFSRDQENVSPLSTLSPSPIQHNSVMGESDSDFDSPRAKAPSASRTIRGLSRANTEPLLTNGSNLITQDKAHQDCSDGSSDDEPPIKNGPSRTIRGLRAKTFPIQGPNIFQSDVYSTRVSSSWKAFRAGKVKTAVSDEDDGEEDISDIFTAKAKGKKNHKAKKNPIEEHLEPLVVDVEQVDDDLTIDRVEEASTSILQESAPPPTPPPEFVPRARRKKTPRGLKTAYKNLEKAHQIDLCLDDDDGDVSIIDDPNPSSSQEAAREIPIKVRSRSGVQRFTCRRTQHFGYIMQQMALHEGVSEDRIAMIVRDTTIQPFDTVESLGVGVADIIECHIRQLQDVGQSAASSDDEIDELVDPSLICLRVQDKGPKSRVVIKVHKTEPLGRLMRKFAYEKKLELTNLRFEFDGEEISSTDTPEDLDMEDDYCIDVIGVS